MPLVFPLFRMVWIGACALAMLALTRRLLGLPIEWGWLDGFVFGSTVFGYHFSHPVTSVRWLAWLAGLLAGVGWVFLPRSAQWATLGPSMLWGLYYGMPRLPNFLGLRAYPIAKPIAVALAWSWVTVWLPLSPERWYYALPLFTGRATFIFALALAYDLLDLDYDRQRGFATLAGQLGPPATLRLVDLALSAAVVCIGANFALGYYTLSATLAMLLSLGLSAVTIRWLLQSPMTLDWQKTLVDGLMVLQWGMVEGLRG